MQRLFWLAPRLTFFEYANALRFWFCDQKRACIIWNWKGKCSICFHCNHWYIIKLIHICICYLNVFMYLYINFYGGNDLGINWGKIFLNVLKISCKSVWNFILGILFFFCKMFWTADRFQGTQFKATSEL